MTMIECKLIREGGTFADIGGITYHFAPQADGAHVAQVSDEEHADRFLSIDGYRLYRGTSTVQAKPLDAVVSVILAEPQAVAESEAPASDEKSPAEVRAELAAEFERLYGEAPHPRTGIEKLRKLIAEKQTV